MKRQNKQNILSLPFKNHSATLPNEKISANNFIELAKSTHQLLVIKSKGQKNNDFNRFTCTQSINQKHNKIMYGDPSNNFEDSKHFSAYGSANIPKDIKGSSTIEMLKKEAMLLDLEQNLGTIPRLSTLEPQQNILSQNIFSQTIKFRKPNNRKLARGRPQLYNIVRNHKRELAQIQNQYRTQVLKKLASNWQKDAHSESFEKFREGKKEIQQQKVKAVGRSIDCMKKSKRLTFIERLRRIESEKKRCVSNQINAIHSKKKLKNQISDEPIILKTLL